MEDGDLIERLVRIETKLDLYQQAQTDHEVRVRAVQTDHEARVRAVEHRLIYASGGAAVLAAGMASVVSYLLQGR